MDTNEAQAGTEDISRRSFYTGMIYGIWGVITASLAAPAAVYLLFPPSNRKTADWIDAGDIGSIPSGVPTEVSFQRKRVDGWKVTSEKTTAWVLRESEEKVVAYSPQCTHLGCAYHWEGQSSTFVCPCHNSEFSKTGEVLTGPAPRPLDRYPVKIEAGRLKLGPLNQNA